ncbi:Zinc finger C3H1-type /CCCH-type domain [Cryptosporidium tyzzeri]|nr:Zinc finger C3H1-type /CCCH-type domain [Cryptosporidium tyzzeri]
MDNAFNTNLYGVSTEPIPSMISLGGLNGNLTRNNGERIIESLVSGGVDGNNTLGSRFDGQDDSVTADVDTEGSEESHNQYWKTKLCLMFSKGACKNGDNCRFAHGSEDLRTPVNLKKTKLCPFWLSSACSIGENCPFAHGTTELRVTNDFYKTSVCRYWKMGVKCDAGVLCRHAHGEAELRKKTNKHLLRRKDDQIPPSVREDDLILPIRSNKFNENSRFLFQVPPPPPLAYSSSGKPVSSLGKMRQSHSHSNLYSNSRTGLGFNTQSIQAKTLPPILRYIDQGGEGDHRMKRNYSCDDIFRKGECFSNSQSHSNIQNHSHPQPLPPQFNSFHDNQNSDITNVPCIRGSSSLNNLRSWDSNSKSDQLNTSQDNIFGLVGLDKDPGLSSGSIIKNRFQDDDSEKQLLDLRSNETDLSSFCSLKRMEDSSNSLVSNISDLSFGDDFLGGVLNNKLQNHQVLKHSSGHMLNSLFNCNTDNHSGSATGHSCPPSSIVSEKKRDEINCLDYFKNVADVVPSEGFLSKVSQFTNSSEVTHSPILVKIKFLDSAEISSLSTGEVPAILIPSEDMKYAKVHFLSI